jgi:hypothetical protein
MAQQGARRCYSRMRRGSSRVRRGSSRVRRGSSIGCGVAQSVARQLPSDSTSSTCTYTVYLSAQIM